MIWVNMGNILIPYSDSLSNSQVGRVFTNKGDWGLILGQVIPKTQKMVHDATLLNTQHYMYQG